MILKTQKYLRCVKGGMFIILFLVLFINSSVKEYAKLIINYSENSTISCKKLFDGDELEISKAEFFEFTHSRQTISDDNYLLWTRKCDTFKQERGYISSSTVEEKGFPLAFSIMMYKNVEQMERLLRVIYRTQNYYCIHVDKKAPQEIHDTVKAISDCFPNVIKSSRMVEVKWGKFTVLESDLICMKELLRFKKWKYFINLTGQMFPLVTNYEMVTALKSYDGKNIIGGSPGEVFQLRHFFSFSDWTFPIPNGIQAPPPYNVTISKGAVHIAAIREFVKFIFEDKKVQTFLEWCKTTLIPDEAFFSTVNNEPIFAAPGAFVDKTDDFRKDGTKMFFKLWDYDADNLGLTCHGMYQRKICVPAVRDLSMIGKRKEFFFNKLVMSYSPVVFKCLEENYFKKVTLEMNRFRL